MSENAVALQVLIRCRPFASADKLGVLISKSESGESGEIELLDEAGSRFGRWGFSRCWWSAYNYERFTDEESQEMIREVGSEHAVSQAEVYADVGARMKQQFLDGNAVVMFAYGLSGSGKTYSVFGPDMSGLPEAWYNFDTPHHDWGVFPRLAHDIMTNHAAAGAGKWKVSIKYFQNVVDHILDLLTGEGADEGSDMNGGGGTSEHISPSGPRGASSRTSSMRRRRSTVKISGDGGGSNDEVESRHIKDGFHVDAHGFVDITWCRRREVTSWHELRETFKRANGRKAIAPTQFNNASTRGHCILVFEANMPHPHERGVRRSGRLYVCDLAGAEPAAEVHCAQYRRIVDEGEHGEQQVRYEYVGRNPDKRKTDELVNQGKKINLSLSEMTGFFRQMVRMQL